MCSQSEFHYQFPSLLEAIEFSPSFFLSLFDHFDKYIKSIEKIFPTVLNYQKYIEYMSKSLELVHKTSSTASEMHAINQLHKPLIQDIFAKLENISKLSLLPSNSIELFKTNCINTLNLQINKFRKFMDFKFELEEINKIFFDCLVDKKNHELIVSSHNSMNEKHATLYDRLLLKYKIFIVRFTKKLRARIRELDVAIYMSSSYYLSEISKLHVTVIEKPLNPSNESTTALEFILKNSQRDKEADQNELRKILNQLPQYDTDITQQDNTILTTTGKNIGAAARRHAVKGINFLDSLIPKAIRPEYGILDKKNGIFWGQGLEDKSPIPLFYLCHCLVVDDQSNLSSTSFEIVSYSCHMSIKAPSFRDKNLWVSEIKLGIESSLKSVKYKIQDYHISISGMSKMLY
ncbi:hypothetical protein HZS_8160 [Henneguya salminicola]|nr:hypothetical protein HZS_8160 [Henneguya salminicola]